MKLFHYFLLSVVYGLTVCSVAAAGPACSESTPKLVGRYLKCWRSYEAVVQQAVLKGLLKLHHTSRLQFAKKQELMELNLLPPDKEYLAALATKRHLLYNKKSKGVDRFYSLKGEPIYPENHGFIGEPETIILTSKYLIDRYGSPKGRFFALYGAEFSSRALTKYEKAGFAKGVLPYHVYNVNRPIAGVKLGIAAPWFGEKGGCTQGRLPKGIINYLGPENGDFLSEVAK